MDTSEAPGTFEYGGIDHATAMLRAAAGTRKCWQCGCLRHALADIDQAQPLAKRTGAFDAALEEARDHLLPERYECLGCDVCYPAVALTDLAADGSIDLINVAPCPTESPEERAGWPPLPGAYTLLRYGAPVAVCTLNDPLLADSIARAGLSENAIVGTFAH
jgi:tetrahydromethanopterin S-methyltransferase subunit A